MSILSHIGRWLFILGLALCVVTGMGILPALSQHQWGQAIIAGIGLLVGFFNVSGKESTSFLVAGIALFSAATAADSVLSKLGDLGPMVTNIMTNLVTFVGAAMLIVALLTLFKKASD